MKALEDFWKKHFLWLELGLVILIWALFVYWCESKGGKDVVETILKERHGTVYGAVSAIFGSLLGFAITAESIVLGLSGSEQLEVVRKSVHYKTLWKVFMSTIRSLGIATILCIVALVFDRDLSPCRWFMYPAVFGGLWATARLCRCIWILEQVVLLASQRK